MRIGIVLSQTPRYSETFFNTKISGLIKNGVEVLLLVQNAESDFTLCPVRKAPKVHKNILLQFFAMCGVFTKLLLHSASVVKFWKLERKEGTRFKDIVKKIYVNAHMLSTSLDWLHFGFATQALGSECVAKAINAKMAVSFRGFDINVYPLKHKGCYASVWAYVDKVHSISNYLYKRALALGLDNAVSYTIITPAVVTETLPKPFKKTTETLQFVTVARLTWIKGLHTAIEAMKTLKNDGLLFTYHIIGEGTLKDTERYAYQVYEAGLNDVITFHGKLSHQETLQMMANSDMYIQPSLNEGFCNAVLEAQALGKTVLATNTGGISENLVDGKTGWLFAVEDTQALVQKIYHMLKRTSEEKDAISNRAKERVQQYFTVAKQEQAFLDFYSA